MDFPLVLDFRSWSFQGVRHKFGEFRGVKACFIRVKWQIRMVFLEMYIYHQPIPSLDFFWNNPILMKRGRECLTCMSPTSLPRSDLGIQLDLAEMYFTQSLPKLASHTWGKVEEWRNALILHYRFKLIYHCPTLPHTYPWWQEAGGTITTLYLLTIGIIQTKMEIAIRFFAPNLGLSPKYDKAIFWKWKTKAS